MLKLINSFFGKLLTKEIKYYIFILRKIRESSVKTMKKKYIICLVVIGLMLAVTLSMGTGYGLWVSTNNQDELSSTTIGCFKIYFQDSKKNVIEMKNITPVTTKKV